MGMIAKDSTMLPIIRSDRLVIRPLQITDVDDAYQIFSNPKAFEHFGDGVRTYKRVKESTERLAAKWEKEGKGDFAVCLEDRMIGEMLLLENDDMEFELGYVFHPNFWGYGYATEACAAGLGYGTIP